MWFYIILLAVVAFFVYANYLGKQEAKVGLSIATFGLNLSVYDLRIGYNKFWIYVDFDNSGNKFQYSGSSIGDIQFNISKACKMRAQDRDGVEFNKYMTDIYTFNVGVEKDGERLTYDQYINLTTKEMRSTKKPIAYIERYEHSAPLSGYGEIIHRKKL